MTFKDKIKQLAEEAFAQANSEENREKARALAAAGKEKAQAFIASESGQRIIETATTVSRQVLGNVVNGDSVKKAAAKVTKEQMRPKGP